MTRSAGSAASDQRALSPRLTRALPCTRSAQLRRMGDQVERSFLLLEGDPKFAGGFTPFGLRDAPTGTAEDAVTDEADVLQLVRHGRFERPALGHGTFERPALLMPLTRTEG